LSASGLAQPHKATQPHKFGGSLMTPHLQPCPVTRDERIEGLWVNWRREVIIESFIVFTLTFVTIPYNKIWHIPNIAGGLLWGYPPAALFLPWKSTKEHKNDKYDKEKLPIPSTSSVRSLPPTPTVIRSLIPEECKFCGLCT
jgi:hypothetical protein